MELILLSICLKHRKMIQEILGKLKFFLPSSRLVNPSRKSSAF
jgi:hypothetical protein